MVNKVNLVIHHVIEDEEDGEDVHGDGGFLITATAHLDDDIGEHAEDYAVGDAIGEGHGDDGDEGGECLGEVGEIDVDDALYHEHAYDDEGAGGGCWWTRLGRMRRRRVPGVWIADRRARGVPDR